MSIPFARNNIEIERILASDLKSVRKYSENQGDFMVEDTRYSWRQIPDSSNRNRVYQDFHPDKFVISIYDSSGKLKERITRAFYADYALDRNNSFVVKFNPHGRIIGEREKYSPV